MLFFAFYKLHLCFTLLLQDTLELWTSFLSVSWAASALWASTTSPWGIIVISVALTKPRANPIGLLLPIPFPHCIYILEKSEHMEKQKL